MQETPRARALVRANFQDYGEQPLADVDAIVYSEVDVLGDWLPTRT